MGNEVAISFNRLSKRYQLDSQAQDGPQIKVALNEITFDVKEGERWGIIGRNGSGKSTLLKILAGIVKPTSGTVLRAGTLSHILEVGSNFIPELSGRENVSIFFRTHGLTREQALEASEQARTLADIGIYFDEVVRNYSSGMYLRLAFAASVQLSADVLLIDEIFSVGDAAFREKLRAYFFDNFTSNRTLLLVSHNPEEIVEFCTHCLWLEQGEVKMLGTAKEVESAYYYQLAKEHSEASYLNPSLIDISLQKDVAAFAPVENDFAAITDFTVKPVEGNENITYDAGACFNIQITKKISGITLHPQIIIYDYLMKPVLMLIPHPGSESDCKILQQKELVGNIFFKTQLHPNILTFGNFYAELRIGKDDATDKVFNEEAIRLPMKIHFEVKQGLVHDYIGGTGDVFVKPNCEWEVKKSQ